LRPNESPQKSRRETLAHDDPVVRHGAVECWQGSREIITGGIVVDLPLPIYARFANRPIGIASPNQDVSLVPRREGDAEA
jgi:hypothetical protein